MGVPDPSGKKTISGEVLARFYTKRHYMGSSVSGSMQLMPREINAHRDFRAKRIGNYCQLAFPV